MEPANRSHVCEEALERYSLRQLTGLETEAVEEHILLCSSCQERLRQVDEFVEVMRRAAAELEDKQTSMVKKSFAAFPLSWPQLWSSWKPVWAAGAAAAVLALVLAPWQRSPHMAPHDVLLESTRGVEAPQNPVAPSDRPLVLKVDLTELQLRPAYRLEVVDALGQVVWKTDARADQGAIAVAVERGLKPGVYWVRLYDAAAGGELLREYGLCLQ